MHRLTQMFIGDSTAQSPCTQVPTARLHVQGMHTNGVKSCQPWRMAWKQLVEGSSTLVPPCVLPSPANQLKVACCRPGKEDEENTVHGPHLSDAPPIPSYQTLLTKVPPIYLLVSYMMWCRSFFAVLLLECVRPVCDKPSSWRVPLWLFISINCRMLSLILRLSWSPTR